MIKSWFIINLQKTFSGLFMGNGVCLNFWDILFFFRKETKENIFSLILIIDKFSITQPTLMFFLSKA